MGIKLSEFYDMSLYEWIIVSEGYNRRKEKELEMLALVGNIDLFKELQKTKKPKEELSAEKFAQDFKKMKARFGSKIKKDGRK